MTRTRKWLLGIGITVLVLIALFFAALAWLVYTPSGLRFALDRGEAMLQGQFSYVSASGTLAGTTTIDGLHYRDADGDTLRIKHASLHLQPWALLTHRLHVSRARIDDIKLDLAPPNPANKSAGFSLKPPLTVVLDDVLLTHIVVSENGKQTFAANSLAIAGLWSSKQLVVRQLALRAPEGSVDLEGTLAIARGHRGHGTAKIDWTLDGTRYTGTLSSQSDGKTARLRATLTAPVPAKLDATLALDAGHAWTLALDVPTFDARALPALPEKLQTLALNLHGTGNAQAGKLAGNLVANGHVVSIDPAQFRYDGKTLTLDPLRLRSPSMPGVVTATGVVHLGADPMTAALDVSWKDVRLPADLVGQPLATHGKLHFTGGLEHFALQGGLAIGPPGNLSNLQVDLAGTPQSIQLNALKLVQKHGGLDAHGSIGLQPRITWELDATARKFDPGAILAGWNGALDFKLATTGAFTPQGPVASLKLDDAGGTLRGRSIAGSKADVKITPDNLLDGTLLLVVGNSRIHATGKAGKRTDATLTLDVASLDDWLPKASGSLHGQFHVTGKWPALGVRGQLHGDKLVAYGKHVASLRLQASIPDIAKPGGTLDLSMDGVVASGLAFDSVRLDASGTEASHQLHLQAQGKQLGVALTLHGSWQAKARRWTGTLSDVELTPQGLPAWRQQQASTITWQRGALTLSQFCLAAGAPELCLAADRNAKGTLHARYNLQHFPLQMLASLVPSDDPFHASGELSGSGEFSIGPGGTLDGNAELSASAGSIAYASDPEQPLLAWSSLAINAQGNGNTQHIRLHAALDDGGHVAGDITASGAEHALAGTLDVDLRSLAFLEALSPEVANVKGSVTGTLQLGGTLTDPRFTGRIQTQDFSAELPRAGLKLHDGQFAISGDPDGRLALTGQITSGKGVLHIDGNAGIAANAPLSLDIKGENVLVADTPAAHVLASPDLHITRADGVFAMTGNVTIPSAQIKVEKLPGQGPSQASPDIVIVDAPPAKQVTPLAMQADITVTLGKDVKVQGYGFDGTVKGQLAVHVQPGRTATGRGQISVSGKYQAYGQDLTIDNGRLLFAGTRLDNPGLAMRATRHIRNGDVTVGLDIRGTAQHPVLTIFSNPPMQQSEALSYLVTGRPLDQLKSGEGNTLQTAAQALGGLAGSRLAKAIGPRLGLEASVSSSEALGASAFTVGKYLSPRLFLSYGVGLFTPGTVITLRYTINSFLQFEAENATTGNRASLNYRIEK